MTIEELSGVKIEQQRLYLVISNINSTNREFEWCWDHDKRSIYKKTLEPGEVMSFPIYAQMLWLKLTINMTNMHQHHVPMRLRFTETFE